MTQKPKLFLSLHIAHSALLRAADTRLRAELEISTTQLGVLFLAAKSDGISVGAIARELALSKSSVTGLIDRMCASGLVRREASKADGRVMNVFLTDKGRALIPLGKRETERLNVALTAGFTDAEQQVIHRFLTHISETSDELITGTD